MDDILKNVLNSPLSSNDKKSHREETKDINSLISASTQINKEILDRVLPEKDKEKSKRRTIIYSLMLMRKIAHRLMSFFWVKKLNRYSLLISFFDN